MKKMTWLLRIIGIIQITLGVLYLFAPAFMLNSMGHSAVGEDIYYPLGMLASRFIAYGVAMIYISSNPLKYKLWAIVMIAIQALDLLGGIVYTATGVVSLELSGFAMFNASWMIVLLWLWMPKEK